MDTKTLVSKILTYKGDPKQLVEDHFLIRDKEKVVVPFKFNDSQLLVYDEIQRLRHKNKPVRILILKARQLGMSSMVLALQLCEAILHPGSTCLTVSYDKEKSGQHLLSRIKDHYRQLPEWLRPMWKYNNVGCIEFANPSLKEYIHNPGINSKLYIDSAESIDVGRSFTVNYAHLTEFAKWPRPAETLSSLMQAVPQQGTCIIETTASGASGLFYEMWQDAAKDPDAGWLPIFIPFWVNPEYCHYDLSPADETHIIETLSQEEKTLVNNFGLTLGQISWMRWCVRVNCSGSMSQFMQEYAPTAEDCFLVQGESVFSKEKIRFYNSRVKPGHRGFLQRGPKGNVEFVESNNGPLTLWDKPRPGWVYSIGVDPCSGVGEVFKQLPEAERARLGRGGKVDYAAMQVIALKGNDRYSQVAEFHDFTSPHRLAQQAMMLGEFFNKALIMPEATGVGQALMAELRFNYPNLGYYERVDKRSLEGISRYLGWDTNVRSAQLLRQELLSVLNEGRIEIMSKALIKEMTTYVYKKDSTKMEAAAGCHDDLLMALGLALMGAKQTSDSVLPIKEFDDYSGSIWTPNGLAPLSTGGKRRSKSDDWMFC